MQAHAYCIFQALLSEVWYFRVVLLENFVCFC